LSSLPHELRVRLTGAMAVWPCEILDGCAVVVGQWRNHIWDAEKQGPTVSRGDGGDSYDDQQGQDDVVIAHIAPTTMDEGTELVEAYGESPHAARSTPLTAADYLFKLIVIGALSAALVAARAVRAAAFVGRVRGALGARPTTRRCNI
jgi:hypothetical protein